MSECLVCKTKEPSPIGCGRDDCPFPRSAELRKKMDAYKKRVKESEKAGRRVG